MQNRVILLLMIVCSLCVFMNPLTTRMTHPRPGIVTVGNDDAVLLAIVKNESGFRPEVVSSRGAVGLMQITPIAAQWYSQRGQSPVSNLRNPEDNLRVGFWMLQELRMKYNNDVRKIAASYNAGSAQTDKWIATGGEQWERLAYMETQIYIRRIERDAKIYQKILKKR